MLTLGFVFLLGLIIALMAYLHRSGALRNIPPRLAAAFAAGVVVGIAGTVGVSRTLSQAGIHHIDGVVTTVSEPRDSVCVDPQYGVPGMLSAWLLGEPYGIVCAEPVPELPVVSQLQHGDRVSVTVIRYIPPGEEVGGTTMVHAELLEPAAGR